MRVGSQLRWGVLAATVVVQHVVLYVPSPPDTGGLLSFPGADKVVHVGVFAAVAAAARRCALPGRWVLPVLAVQAAGSEVVQHLLLADRAGDPLDVVADLVGVALGWSSGRVLPWRARSATMGGWTARGGD